MRGIETLDELLPKPKIEKKLLLASGKAGVRVFAVHREERLEYKRGEREKAMRKVQEELEALGGERSKAN